MDSLVRWNPWRELDRLERTASRLLERDWLEPFFESTGALFGPTVDMYETDDSVVVKAVVPGVKPEDLEIKLVGNSLTIRGEVKEEEESKGRNYLRRERRYGSFCRTLSVPDVNADKATAEFENGVLTLTLPKSEAVKPKTIEVKVK